MEEIYNFWEIRKEYLLQRKETPSQLVKRMADAIRGATCTAYDWLFSEDAYPQTVGLKSYVADYDPRLPGLGLSTPMAVVPSSVSESSTPASHKPINFDARPDMMDFSYDAGDLNKNLGSLD